MIPIQYVWFVWSLVLLAIWGVVFTALRSRQARHEMMVVSLWTALFGLSEPLFVPDYWSPPSLFNLAQRTGFDIESILFTFGIAGISTVLYELIFPSRHRTMSAAEHAARRHRWHFWAVVSGPAVFFALASGAPLNPIYAFFIAAAVGGIFTVYCRPDLTRKMVVGGLLFTVLYALYFSSLIIISPGYVRAVWNLQALSGILVLGIPLEELLFAFGVGFLWSGIYEHVRWRKLMHP